MACIKIPSAIPLAVSPLPIRQQVRDGGGFRPFRMDARRLFQKSEAEKRGEEEEIIRHGRRNFGVFDQAKSSQICGGKSDDELLCCNARTKGRKKKERKKDTDEATDREKDRRN